MSSATKFTIDGVEFNVDELNEVVAMLEEGSIVASLTVLASVKASLDAGEAEIESFFGSQVSTAIENLLGWWGDEFVNEGSTIVSSCLADAQFNILKEDLDPLRTVVDTANDN